MGVFSWLERRAIRRAMLFSFWDGHRVRRADGQQLWRRYRTRSELADPLLLERLRSDDPEGAETYLNALAEVFEVERYDWRTGKGLTDAELLDVAARFGDWVSKKKA